MTPFLVRIKVYAVLPASTSVYLTDVAGVSEPAGYRVFSTPPPSVTKVSAAVVLSGITI